MKRRIWAGLLLAVLLAAGFFAWKYFFPTPEAAIRKQLKELAKAASIAPNEGPLAQAINAQKLTTYFTENAELIVDAPGQSRFTISGIDDLRAIAVRARSHFPGLTIDFPDIKIDVGADKASAVADVTARGSLGNDPNFMLQEIKITFKKVGHDWLVRRVETMRIFR